MRAVDIPLWACGHSGDLDTHIAGEIWTGEIWTPTSQDDPDTRPPARHGMPGTSGHFGGTSDTHTVDRERIAHRRRPSCTGAKSTPQHSTCGNRCRKRVKRRPERITRGGAPWIRHPSFFRPGPFTTCPIPCPEKASTLCGSACLLYSRSTARTGCTQVP